MASDADEKFRVKRKPISGPPPPYRLYEEENDRPVLPPRLPSAPTPAHDASRFRPVAVSNPTAASDSSVATHNTQTPAQTAIQKAYGETSHFLGGLISHPAESNKHFTILRHSHGVAFYRGSATTVAISIFSDAPLPPNRTMWLQSRGYSGKTGMKAKAFFRFNDDWLNVTPSVAVKANQVNPVDERAWQRDISKFYKRASGRVKAKHRLRETAIVRIPVEAGDGYFCVILCQGDKKNTLCTSPVFRVLSTSFDPSSIRGASLSTLPLEIGAMAVGIYAQTAAQRFVSPAVTAIKATVSPYQPSWMVQTAAEAAFAVSGAGDVAAGPSGDTDVKGPYSGHRDSFAIENGPTKPYPIVFQARSEIAEHIIVADQAPSFTLKKAPDWVKERFDGYYFGWARCEETEERATTAGVWRPAILDVRNFDPTGAARVNISQAMRRICSLRLLGEVQLHGQIKIEIRVMGFLRPPALALSGYLDENAYEDTTEAAMIADACDASFAQSILDHPAWAPNISSGNTSQADLGMMQRTRNGLSNVAASGKKIAEQVPLQWIGVRSPMAEMKDKRVTVNGLYIIR